MSYESDRLTAQNRGYLFFVAVKAEHGSQWAHVRDEIADLDEAMALARSQTAFEAAVYVVRTGGGYIYWSSRHPDVYNATVIELEISQPKDEDAA